MKRKIKKLAAVVLCAALLTGGALAAGLAAGDSLISLSYLEQIFIPSAAQEGAEQAEGGLDAVFQTASGQLEQVAERYLDAAQGGASGGFSTAYARRTFSLDDRLTLKSGAGILVEAGSLLLEHGGTVVDVTTGQSVPSGTVLEVGHRYVTAEETQASLCVRSDAARTAVEGVYMVEQSGTRATPFTDITPDQWYHDAVNRAYEMGLFAGTGDGSIFAPEVRLDRAMMMTVLFHLAGDPEEERSSAAVTFPDVKAGEWYESYVRWAGQQGIGAGYGDGAFRPLQTMTRREVVQFLYNFGTAYLKLELTERGDLSGLEGADVLQADGWGEEAMSWAVGAGIISQLRPNDHPGRGEVAAIVAAFAEKYIHSDAPN